MGPFKDKDGEPLQPTWFSDAMRTSMNNKVVQNEVTGKFDARPGSEAVAIAVCELCGWRNKTNWSVCMYCDCPRNGTREEIEQANRTKIRKNSIARKARAMGSKQAWRPTQEYMSRKPIDSRWQFNYDGATWNTDVLQGYNYGGRDTNKAS